MEKGRVCDWPHPICGLASRAVFRSYALAVSVAGLKYFVNLHRYIPIISLICLGIARIVLIFNIQ